MICRSTNTFIEDLTVKRYVSSRVLFVLVYLQICNKLDTKYHLRNWINPRSFFDCDVNTMSSLLLSYCFKEQFLIERRCYDK